MEDKLNFESLNCRQKILYLFKEGRTPEEIIKQLKDEKVSNIKSYVARVRMDLDKNKIKEKSDDRIEAIENKGVKVSRREVTIHCVICKQPIMIFTNDPRIYKYKIVQENFVCEICERKLKANNNYIMDTVTCECRKEFKTRVLKENFGKYNIDFKCADCIDKAEGRYESKKESKPDEDGDSKSQEENSEV